MLSVKPSLCYHVPVHLFLSKLTRKDTEEDNA